MIDESAAMLAEQLVPLTGVVLGVGLPMAAAIVWITLNYRRRRRLMELHHVERMAAIERGMDVPPLPLEVIEGSIRRKRTSLLPGLIWFFVGLALIIMMHTADDPAGAYAGFIPLGVGLAYLIYYFVEGRKLELPSLQQEVARSESSHQL